MIPILPPPAAQPDEAHAVQQGELVELQLASGDTMSATLQKFLRTERRITVCCNNGDTRELPFSELTSLQLTHPRPWRQIEGLAANTVDPNAESSPQQYHVELQNGEVLAGNSLGFRRDAAGLYLYPVQADGRHRYLFIPHGAIEQFRFDPCTIAPPGDEEFTSDAPSGGEIRTPEALEQALKSCRAVPKTRFGEILVKEELITAEQLDEALKLQKEYRAQGKKVQLGQVLVDLGIIDMSDVLQALSEKLGIPFIDLAEFKLNPESLRFLPEELVRKYNFLPVHHFKSKLVVALENPMDWDALDAARFHTSLNIEPVMASREGIENAIRSLYSSPGMGAEIFEDDSDHDEEDRAQGQDESGVQDNVVVKLVNKLIIDAYQHKASDIHIEPYPGKNKTIIRIRKDGTLINYYEVPGRMRSALISRIKIMAELDISERRKPQDGKIDFKKFGPLKIELRVATIPTTHDLEDVVLRLLSSGEPIPMDQLGLSRRNEAALRKLIVRPYGLFFVCGPTGSGKTTTLHSVLGHLNTPDRKIWTAEDPVEITQRGLRQVEVRPKIGFNFAAAMRAFLRADPDIIMVGEMRDKETTSIGIEASLTGHLVLSTLHTNSAPETVTRLLDMGMDPFNFSDALIGILAQRLAKRLCKECKEAYEPSEEEIDELVAEYSFELAGYSKSDKDRQKLHDEVLHEWREYFADENGKFTLYRPTGCRSCDNTGYSGRLGIHELLPASAALKKMILEHGTVAELLQLALSEGMRTLKQDGLEKVMQGLTDAHTVRTVCTR